MKKTAGISALILILVSVVLFFITHSGKSVIYRFKFSGEFTKDKKEISHKRHRIKSEDSFISFNDRDKLITVRGSQILQKESSTGSTSIKLIPRLKGKYIVEFSLFLKSLGGWTPKAYLRQLREHELKRIRLKSEADLLRHRIPLSLKKTDTLEFLFQKTDFGLISDPVFYKHTSKKKKDLVFIITADTLRWDNLGVYNSSKKCTPHLDELSKDSIVFTQGYSTSSWTVPAHMSLFTGLFPDKHQVNYGNEQLGKDVKTLFEILQEKFITYSFNGDHFVSSRFGFNRGFDVYEESFGDAVARDASKQLFTKAKECVTREKSGSALFFLHTYQVHNPYNPEIELAREFYNDDFDRFRFNSLRLIKHGKELFIKVPKEEKKEIERIYDAAAYTFDARLGDFIAFLKDNSLYDNSTIIFLSDHGEEFMDHGAWEHGHSLYNELIKIPLIVKLLGNKDAGKRINRVVSIVDILPTLLDLYKIKYDKTFHVDGISLLRAIDGKIDKDRMVSAYLAPNALRDGIPTKIAAVSGDFKYIFHQKMQKKDLDKFVMNPPELADELFDIFNDSSEKNNIIESKRKEAIRFMDFIRKLEYKKGKKGFLKELEERLKSIGYF